MLRNQLDFIKKTTTALLLILIYHLYINILQFRTIPNFTNLELCCYLFHNNVDVCILFQPAIKLTNLTRINHYVRKTFTLLWAIAIFWFYLGNLINFHENRIWGKILIPACYTHSSINKKDGDLVKYAGKDSPSSSFPDSFNAVLQLSDNLFSLLPLWESSIKYASIEAIKPAALAGDNRLRGPPSVS